MTGHRHLDQRLRRIEAHVGRDDVNAWRRKVEANIEKEATLAGNLDPLREPAGVLSLAQCPKAGTSSRDVARRTAWDEIRAEFIADREWAQKGADLIFRRFAEPDFPRIFEEAMGCEAARFADLIRRQWADQITRGLPVPERFHRRATEVEVDAAMPYVLPPLPRSVAVTTARKHPAKIGGNHIGE